MNPAGCSRLAAAHPLRHRQPRWRGARASGTERFAYQSAGRVPAPLLSLLVIGRKGLGGSLFVQT